MHVRKMYLLIAAGVAFLLICANVLQFLIWGQKVIKIENDYKLQLKEMDDQIKNIGPIINIWTVAENVVPGQEISESDLVPLETLQKSMGEAYITDPEQIIGKFYKVGIIPGTPITKDVIMEEELEDSLRQYDVVADIIPVGLKVGDYIDYRLVMPEGEDYITMTHKRVEGIYGKTVTLHLTQEEIYVYQSMLLDSFLIKGSYIYMTKYLEPGVQTAAKTYYKVNPNIAAVLANDPNVLEEIKSQIAKGKKGAIAAEDKQITDKIRTSIIEGRTFVQGYLDSANSAYWSFGNDTKGKSGDGDAEDGSTTESETAKLPNQQPQVDQPARNITVDSPTESKNTQNTKPAESEEESTDSNNDEEYGESDEDGLNILEGIVQ